MIDALRLDAVGDGARFFDFLDVDRRKQIMRDVCAGLTKTQKSIPPKYFYDSHGSRLFEQITRTPEYYLTRTELSILERSAREIVASLSGCGGDIVELGSGSTVKIRKLLDAAYKDRDRGLRYIPLDICGNCIEAVIEELAPLYPYLEVFGIRADFTSRLHMLPRGKKLLVFFGSTIGNFNDTERVDFLGRVKRIMNPDDRLLIGMDMVKPLRVMEAAYNDSRGITQKFNLNMLTNLNRELKADFDPNDFQHLAFYNPDMERIEMHLRAKRAVSAWISDLSMAVAFRKGETIRTEISQKFSRERVEWTFFQAGFGIERWFTDPKKWFSLVLVKPQTRVFGKLPSSCGGGAP
jgi:L-histidine N-alpha-methyltransferase